MHVIICFINPVLFQPADDEIKRIYVSRLEFTVGALLLGSELTGVSTLLLSAVSRTRGKSGVAPSQHTKFKNIELRDIYTYMNTTFPDIISNYIEIF